MVKYLRISSHIRKPFLKYATASFWISLYCIWRKFGFFISAHSPSPLTDKAVPVVTNELKSIFLADKSMQQKTGLKPVSISHWLNWCILYSGICKGQQLKIQFFPKASRYAKRRLREWSGQVTSTGKTTVLTMLSEIQYYQQAAVSKTYTVNHRVDRVLSFLSSRPNWEYPTPSQAGECVPPPPFGSGGKHTRLRERGWGVPIPTRGQTLWYSR